MLGSYMTHVLCTARISNVKSFMLCYFLLRYKYIMTGRTLWLLAVVDVNECHDETA